MKRWPRRAWSWMTFACAGLCLALTGAWASAQEAGASQADAAAATTPAQKPQRIPQPLTAYKGRRIAQAMSYLGADWLVRETREREEACTKLLKVLDLKPGLTICDMGCGNGFYSLKLAEAVGKDGKILAVDIQPEMLSLLEKRAKAAQVENIEPILGSVIDPQLPDESCDLILLVDVYHEFSHPEHMLKAMRKALKPTGQIVLVEFRLEDPRVPIKLLHKMSKKQILKELPPNGYKLVREYDELPWQHVMFFARDDSPLPEITSSGSPKSSNRE
jgi:ubiquinone/menaquinone biosynthesis C-methylase UbiE